MSKSATRKVEAGKEEAKKLDVKKLEAKKAAAKKDIAKKAGAAKAKAEQVEPKKKRMSRKAFDKELERLQAELCRLQEWVVHKGLRVVVLFEGRDAAGKGGVIKRITERVSPRVFRVVALPKPTEREKSQMYIQRYMQHFPAAGEVVIFDRSWYNRAGVEPVMGFCTAEESQRFLESVPGFEGAMVESGINLTKYWLEVSPDEQTRRLQSRIDDPRKVWKLTDMDLASYGKWDEYGEARDRMFAATDTAWAPWYVAGTDDKRRGRLNIITHLLGRIPYEPLQRDKVTLPSRDVSPDTGRRTVDVRSVPEVH